jgi:hypothetical protein
MTQNTEYGERGTFDVRLADNATKVLARPAAKTSQPQSGLFDTLVQHYKDGSKEKPLTAAEQAEREQSAKDLASTLTFGRQHEDRLFDLMKQSAFWTYDASDAGKALPDPYAIANLRVLAPEHDARLQDMVAGEGKTVKGVSIRHAPAELVAWMLQKKHVADPRYRDIPLEDWLQMGTVAELLGAHPDVTPNGRAARTKDAKTSREK